MTMFANISPVRRALLSLEALKPMIVYTLVL